MDKKIIFYSLICLIFILAFPWQALADSKLSLVPASGSYVMGNNFAISVTVDTGGKAVNAAENSLTFDKSKFIVSSIDASQSIFSIWVKYPAFSNSNGTISFSGGAPNPGFNGTGSIFTINFKGVALGTGDVSFGDSGRVLLNDGVGTDTVVKTSGGTYTILPVAPGVSCSASPSFANVNQEVTFSAKGSGGVGGYVYSWSNACTGDSQTCKTFFDSSGLKTATVTATSGDKTSSANCSLYVAPVCAAGTAETGQTETGGATVAIYTVCTLDQKCVPALGIGKDQCKSDNDCIPVITAITAPKEAIQAIQKTVNTPQGSVATKAISTVGAVVATAEVASVVAFSPFELFLAISRLFGLLFAVLGLKKRIKPWGVVYDSVTKQPLDPAYVVLSDIKGKKVLSAITDIDGRYGFLAAPGTYQISVSKTNYVFPSKKLLGRPADELYNDLYFGQTIEIKQDGQTITKNIPMDPLKFDWNEFAKRDKKLMKFYSRLDVIMRQIFDLFFVVGFAVAIVAYFSAPYPYNLIILIIYLLLLFLRLIGIKPKAYGRISSEASKDPLSFAVLRVLMPGSNIEVTHKIADKYGRYYCLVPKGKYCVKIEKKNNDGSYSEVFTSQTVDASSGIIKNNFKV